MLEIRATIGERAVEQAAFQEHRQHHGAHPAIAQYVGVGAQNAGLRTRRHGQAARLVVLREKHDADDEKHGGENVEYFAPAHELGQRAAECGTENLPEQDESEKTAERGLALFVGRVVADPGQ